ncbi:hypothetical protein AB0E63_21540 [Kribbella sp. NPDC026596]|uniref:hypothetical protein n=1 Tax=Kribbella sp. NPDC026596 TaxID=3155122 RepID=UPI0033D2EC2E
MEAAGQHLRTALARVTGATPPERRSTHLIDRINASGAFGEWLTARGLVDVTVSTHEFRLSMTPEISWLVVTGSGYVAALSGLDEQQTREVRDAYLESLDQAGVNELDATTLIGVGTRSR